MAGRDIQVNFISDAKSVVTDANRMADAIDKGADSLEALGREGQRAGDKVADGLQDGTRDGARYAERNLDSVADDLKALARQARETGDDVGDGIRHGTDQAKEGVQSFKEEGIQNVSEFASSFKGDMSDVADGVQGLTGGLATALPPLVGIPIAIAGALGAAALQGVQENAEKTKQAVQDAFDDMVESGNNFASQDFLLGKVKDVLKDDELTALAKQTSKSIGLPFDTVVAALAGIPNAVDEVQARIASTNEKLSKDAQNINAKVASDADIAYTANNKLEQKIRDQVGAYDSASGKASAYSNILGNMQVDASNAASGVSNVGSAFDKLPSSKSIRLEADTTGIDAALRRAQNTIDRNPLRVKLQGADAYGRPVV